MRRDQAALSALLKLRQVLPTRIASRLGELDAAFTYTARPDEGQISPALLLDLATACRRGERIRPTYRDRAGTMSTRRVDPLDGGWRPLRPTQVNESGTTFMLNP
jgi:predicted DNA-binding transcriptional regulator YafY